LFLKPAIAMAVRKHHDDFSPLNSGELSVWRFYRGCDIDRTWAMPVPVFFPYSSNPYFSSSQYRIVFIFLFFFVYMWERKNIWITIFKF
jgi:hypothetical protein